MSSIEGMFFFLSIFCLLGLSWRETLKGKVRRSPDLMGDLDFMSSLEEGTALWPLIGHCLGLATLLWTLGLIRTVLLSLCTYKQL